MKDEKAEKESFFEKYGELLRVVAAGVLVAALTIVDKTMDINGYVILAGYIALYLFIGIDVVISTVKRMAKNPFNEGFLMVLATVCAFLIGEYFEAVLVMLLNAVGELIEDYAEDKSESAIVDLTDIMPETATVVTNGKEQKKAIAEIAEGELLLIRTGDKIVCDGVIVSGAATVNNSMLTGESVPISLLTGQKVYSGGIVINGAITVKVEKRADQSSAARIIKSIKESENKSKNEKFLDKFAKVYTPIVISLAVLTAVVPTIFGGEFITWFKRALNLLVISCPCAVIISVPLTYFSGIGNAFSKGVIVKGSAALEKAAEVSVFAFDKTGTLTSGNFEVIGVYPEDRRAEILKAAAKIEKNSTHPIALAIVKAGDVEGVLSGESVTSDELPGKGIVSTSGAKIAVGNLALMMELGISVEGDNDGGTVVYVAKGGEYLGRIVVGDKVKDGAKRTIEYLKAAGAKVVMLTGDNEVSAEKVAHCLAIDEWRAGLLPEGKSDLIKQYGAIGKVAFVGDGINDAPAIAAAHLGVAMGGGADIAATCAEVVLTDDNAQKVPRLIKIAKKTKTIAMENVIGAIAIKAIALALSVAGVLPMWGAILADVGSMMVACANAARALRG